MLVEFPRYVDLFVTDGLRFKKRPIRVGSSLRLIGEVASEEKNIVLLAFITSCHRKIFLMRILGSKGKEVVPRTELWRTYSNYKWF
jgi:hypothetical protein